MITRTRTLAHLAALTLAAALSQAALAAPCAGFSDVDATSDYCADVTWAKNHAITLGCTASTYCPGAAVTRAQMAIFLHRALKQFGDNTSDTAPGTGAPCTLGEATLSIGVQGHGLPADGRLLAIASYESLFQITGTRYGGNGSTTFALPDLRSAAPSGTTYMVCVTGTFPGAL